MSQDMSKRRLVSCLSKGCSKLTFSWPALRMRQDRAVSKEVADCKTANLFLNYEDAHGSHGSSEIRF